MEQEINNRNNVSEIFCFLLRHLTVIITAYLDTKLAYYAINWMPICRKLGVMLKTTVEDSLMCTLKLSTLPLPQRTSQYLCPAVYVWYSCNSAALHLLPKTHSSEMNWHQNQGSKLRETPERNVRHNIKKGNAAPLWAWSGPEGSRKLRLPDFMTTAQDGGKPYTLATFTHRKYTWYSFLLEAESTPGP